MRVSRLGLTAVAVAAWCSAGMAQDVVTTSTIDGGGLRTTSANYTMDGSVGGIGGISSASADTAKDGYIGQLTEVVSIVVTSQPDAVAVSGTAQLSGTATLDDSTVEALGGSDVGWSSPNEPYPVFSINSGGLLMAAGFVYAAAPAVVNAYYLGATSNVSLSVFAPSTVGDGIPDWWRAAYFPPGTGTTTNNPGSCATCDPDGTGQNNLFKFVAGLNPTNPASVFVLTVAPVAGVSTQKTLTYNPILIGSGQVYTVQFRTNLTGGAAYATLTTTSALTTNVPQAQVTLTDLSATQTQKFYRVNISLP
ncbi:MAG: hypothetical protein ACLP0A_17985 [Verrucomicrobiia bacterium]